MKVIVNLPETEEAKIELENRVANFRATLLIEKIRQLNVSDTYKKELFNLILQDLKEKMYED